MAVSIAQANALLGGVPGTLYVQPHSGDPGAAGTGNVIAGAQRGAVTIPVASGGQRAVLANVDCPGVPAGANVTHVSYWTALSGGTFQFSEPLGVSVSFLYAGTLRLTSQVFTVTTDAAGGSQTQTSANADTAVAGESMVVRMFVVVSDATSSSDSALPVIPHTDSAATSDANSIRLGVVVADSTAQSDTATRGGAVSDVTDTVSASDANTSTQTFRSTVTDSGSVADAGSATVGGGAQSLALPNGDFEAAIGTVEGDNWWPTGTVGRTTPGLVGAGCGYLDAADDDGTAGIDTWVGLSNRTTKAAIDASTGHLKFKVKPIATTGAAYMYVAVYNAGGTLISTTASNAHLAMLYGTRIGTASDDTSIRFTPSAGVVHDVDFNLKAFASTLCNWADAAKVIVQVAAYGRGFGENEAHLQVDNFVAQ